MGMLTTSMHQMLHDLKLYLYCWTVQQELKPGDYAKHLAYCHLFNTFVHDGMHKMNHVFFSDKAWVHLNGYVNSQNYRLWCAENPHEFVESGLRLQKIGIWYAISRTRLVGPFFFEETMNQESIRTLFTNLSPPSLSKNGGVIFNKMERTTYYPRDDGIPTGIFQ